MTQLIYVFSFSFYLLSHLDSDFWWEICENQEQLIRDMYVEPTIYRVISCTIYKANVYTGFWLFRSFFPIIFSFFYNFFADHKITFVDHIWFTLCKHSALPFTSTTSDTVRSITTSALVSDELWNKAGKSVLHNIVQWFLIFCIFCAICHILKKTVVLPLEKQCFSFSKKLSFTFTYILVLY
jgi:hypothetical protein